MVIAHLAGNLSERQTAYAQCATSSKRSLAGNKRLRLGDKPGARMFHLFAGRSGQ